MYRVRGAMKCSTVRPLVAVLANGRSGRRSVAVSPPSTPLSQCFLPNPLSQILARKHRGFYVSSQLTFDIGL